MTPYYEENGIQIFHGDCREILPSLPRVDAVITDPPYPNHGGYVSSVKVAADYFEGQIETARWFCRTFTYPSYLVFWHELERPPVNLPLVAMHVWHRSNTNRPSNYEAIYEFAQETERASRVFSYPVVSVGLTGCVEATGHPTQKPVKLMKRLIELRGDISMILDPFMGSGTTLRAAKDLGRKAIGIEIEERYCEIAANRLRQEVLQFV
jgi:site-specific DNA-methyltransferase (adenine-specific)